VSAGGVAVQDLEEEQVDGGNRVENPIPPGVADGRARHADRCGCENGSQVIADLPQRGEE